MQLRIGIIIFTIATFFSCAKQESTNVLSSPGFGIIETSVTTSVAGVDLPVYLKSDDIIRGIQFTLHWDETVGQVIKPELTEANPGFTVSAGEASGGQMKVLIFSMSGDDLVVGDNAFLTIPIRIIDTEASAFKITFKDPIFAGPKASSYSIPVSHANLKISK